MAAKKENERAATKAFREKLDAAMADFAPPTLEEMIEEGHKIFKPNRLRPKKRAKKPRGSPGAKRRVTVFPHDNPGEEHTSNQTLTDLQSGIRRKRPRQNTDSDWTFTVGGKREYVAINTLGPAAFSGQYPVWRGRKFDGCMLAALEWEDVRRILHKFYEGYRLPDCFAEVESSFEPYLHQKHRLRK